MSPNHFPDNYDFGVKKYRYLLDIFYKHFCYEGRFVSIGDVTKSRFSDILQQRLKTDTVIQKGGFLSYGVEEKVVAWPESGHPYDALFLETDSCTNEGNRSAGWMKTCQADLLLYAFEVKDVGLVLYLFPFAQLKHWFWGTYLPHLPRPDYGRAVMREANRTEGRVVPIATVVKAVPTRCFLVSFDEECRELKPEVNLHQLREHVLQGRRKQGGSA